jgi:hypothetical protein
MLGLHMMLQNVLKDPLSILLKPFFKTCCLIEAIKFSIMMDEQQNRPVDIKMNCEPDIPFLTKLTFGENFIWAWQGMASNGLKI